MIRSSTTTRRHAGLPAEFLIGLAPDVALAAGDIFCSFVPERDTFRMRFRFLLTDLYLDRAVGPAAGQLAGIVA